MSKKTKVDKSAVGKTAMFNVPLRCEKPTRFRVAVKIISLREKFGRTDVEVEPVAGEGRAFVSSKHIEEVKP